MTRFGVKLIPQPDDITCGPACVAMVREALGARHGLPSRLEVAHYASMCGTNNVIGTVPEGLNVAFAGLGVSTAFNSGEDAATKSLTTEIARRNLVLCRTLTSGVKHWNLAVGMDNGRVAVADPWLGWRELPVGKLLDDMRPRGFDHYVIDMAARPRDVAVLGLHELAGIGMKCEDAIATMLYLGGQAFSAAGGDTEWVTSYLRAATDWNASRFLLVDGDLVGGYLLAERPPSVEGQWGRTAEGVALVVEDNQRGRGYGRLLRDEPMRLGYDTVWGMQLKSLDNLDDWLKTRELIGGTEAVWITARSLRGPSLRQRMAGRSQPEDEEDVASDWKIG